jgi:hypothetical protein
MHATDLSAFAAKTLFVQQLQFALLHLELVVVSHHANHPHTGEFLGLKLLELVIPGGSHGGTYNPAGHTT